MTSRRRSSTAASPTKPATKATSTVKGVLVKLGVRDRVQAVIFAYESGLSAPGRR